MCVHMRKRLMCVHSAVWRTEDNLQGWLSPTIWALGSHTSLQAELECVSQLSHLTGPGQTFL